MKIKTINNIMLVSLIIVMVSGFWVKMAPSMWPGISHGISSIVFAVCVIVHYVQHNRRRG